MPSEYLIAAIAVGGALVAFFLGLWAGLLVTSRYKQSAAALRERADRAGERLKEADTKLATLRASYDSQSETCRVLEEEFANIARERDELRRQSQDVDHGGCVHGGGGIAERDRWRAQREALQAACEAKETESKALQQALVAAQNRYERARDEQTQILHLVDRLQEQLHRLSGIECTANRRQRKLAKLRRTQLRARRRLRAESAPAHLGTPDALPSRPVLRRERRRTRASDLPAPPEGTGPSPNRHW